MKSAYLWQLWPARNWPFSLDEEALLVEELKNLDSDLVEFDRGDVTAVLNMLRLGVYFSKVHAHAPGLKPARLRSAYIYIEERRTASQVAFEALLAAPSTDALLLHATAAKRLAPIPTFWLQRALLEGTPDAPEHIARYLREEIAALDLSVARVEQQLATLGEHALTGTPEELEDEYAQCAALGHTLYNPYGECLWSRPFFIPPRVAALMPPRVADLVGETP
jgi:hypothetical protein